MARGESLPFHTLNCVYISVCICVCARVFLSTQTSVKIHLVHGQEGRKNQKGRKGKLMTQWRSMPFNHCFQYTKNAYFLMLPNKCLALHFNYSFTFYSQVFTEHQLYARHIFLLTFTGKLTFKKWITFNVLLVDKKEKSRVRLLNGH